MNHHVQPLPATWAQQQAILTRVAQGGPLHDVLRDIVLLVEKNAGGSMMASILLLSEDGKRLLDGPRPACRTPTTRPSTACRSAMGPVPAARPPSRARPSS
ncbi:MAG: hypothetical protein ACU0CO_17495 [Shimia sp.]